jgi:tetratricopeptide (TPR) repeat protein
MAAIGLMHRPSRRDFGLADQLLQTLIGRTSDSPAVSAIMARWHVLKVQQGWSDDPRREGQEALRLTQRALDSDPTNVSALVSEGFVLTNLMHRLEEAQERYEVALDISPSDALGRLLRGTLFAFRGEGAKAVRDTERALHLAPRDPHRYFFESLAASACIAAEDYERALALARQSLRSNRGHTSTLRVKAVAEYRLGEGDAARATVRELLRQQPDLTVSGWLRTAPSANFEIGREFARTLEEAGVPS